MASDLSEEVVDVGAGGGRVGGRLSGHRHLHHRVSVLVHACAARQLEVVDTN